MFGTGTRGLTIIMIVISLSTYVVVFVLLHPKNSIRLFNFLMTGILIVLSVWRVQENLWHMRKGVKKEKPEPTVVVASSAKKGHSTSISDDPNNTTIPTVRRISNEINATGALPPGIV